MKTFFSLSLLIVSLLASMDTFAGVVNVRFTNLQLNGSSYCADVQIKAQDIPFELGSATVFFDYSTSAVRNPQFTPLNFNESNTCAANGALAPYKNSFNYLETGASGEGNYAILLLSPNMGCPTVGEEWIDVARFCFEVVDASKSPQLHVNAQYTAFNTVANNGEQLTIGTVEGVESPLGIGDTNPNSVLSAQIAPNYTNDKVQVSYTLKSAGDVHLRVYDMLGQVVMSVDKELNAGTHHNELNLAKLSDGYYLVEIDANGEKAAQKVLLTK